MKRADRQFQPIRPSAASTRDGHFISPRRVSANVEQAFVSVNLQAVSGHRPALAAATVDLLSAALDLTLMLPRPMLEQFVECVIERLDELDGDSDLEPIDEREPEY